MFRAIGKFIKLFLSEDSYLALRERFLNFRKNWTPKKVRSRIQKYYRLAVRYPRIYKKYVSEPIDKNKVLFIEPKNLFSNNFQLIYQLLRENYSFDIHIHLLREFFIPNEEFDKRCVDLMKDLATAKYVFIDEACNVFSRVPIRDETIIAQTWHACGAFKKFGFSTAEKIFGADKKTMETYPNYRKDSFVTVSSPEVVWAYAEAMGLPEDKILPIGVSRTDVYYDEDFKTAARKKLEFFMPGSAGKKVILFAPTFRGRIARAKTATAFSVEQFYEALSDDYVLIMKHHPVVKRPPEIPREYQDFAVDFTNTMTIEELLCVADICISDYSSLIFECSLLEKPMIFFNYDIDEYFDWRGFYYNYDELTPGPAFKTNREMIEYIKNIDTLFDKQQVIDFKNKFMSSCDGHSTERLMDKVFGEDLGEHKKTADSAEASVEVFGGPKVQSFDKWKGMKKLSAADSRKRLTDRYPELKGKKMIAYFGTERVQKYPGTNPYLDWQALFEFLDERYVVLYLVEMPKEYAPKLYQQKRFLPVKGLLSEKELAAAADIILTDCNYAAGVYGFRNKPTYVYLPDYKWFCSDEEDYTESTALLRSTGIFYENMPDLLAAVQGEKPFRIQENSQMDSFRKICAHFD